LAYPIIATVPLGAPPWPTLDPFLFCVHHVDAYPRGNDVMGPVGSLAGRNIGNDFAGKDGWRMYHGGTVPGFPSHPHRGFETITIMRGGFVDHSDSLGATARFGAGDVQWMTAGKGVVHAEMFPLRARDEENPLELFQIWLNLPRADKMVDPYFTMMWDHTIPTVEHTDDDGRITRVRVIAGRLGGATPPPPPPSSWASRPEADLAIQTITLDAGARYVIPAANPGTLRALYLFNGASTVAGTALPSGHIVQVAPEAPIEVIAGLYPVDLLMLQGRPIGEPVVQHGPFVMNTAEEIRSAYADYQRTRFGGWPWPKPDPVHARETGRFARHADGRVEKVS
jgi:redox-sensitive bicupin YhaK (pirin superfamily)